MAFYLSSEIGSSALRHLKDDRGFAVSSSFESGYNSRRRGDVLQSQYIITWGRLHQVNTHDSWDGELMLLSIVEELEHIVADNDAGLAGENILGAHNCG